MAVLYLLLYLVLAIAASLAAAEATYFVWGTLQRWRAARRVANLSARFEFDPKLEARLAHRVLREKQLQRSAEALGRKKVEVAK